MSFPVAQLGRHPAPKDLLGKLLHGVGGVLRATGVALDGLGAAVQGPYALRDELPPNAAWLPFPAGPSGTGAGAAREVPSRPGVKDAPRLSIVEPTKGAGVFVAPSATVLGNVTIGKGSSIWYGATLRGDVNAITIGERTNIQDNVVIHVAKHTPASSTPRATKIGSNVTVGHGALVHACTVGDGCLVGMGATLLDGVVMEPGSVAAGGAVVPPGTTIKTGQIWAGAPAKLLRTVSSEEAAFLVQSADNYAHLAQEHKTENGKAFEELVVDGVISGERAWREKSDIDVHQGVYRDPDTQAILSMR
ncbi:gamma carbonic anhydrase, mitochondrial [Raphidocelis subcapitata]|uniref:Gamma carbonic anhydrase, mitochondrial n=1 Tax=Raphidocelis subcapitata TaxID=307507 RepID=A0A2V0NPQ4_9CHLO|nr:gamma carbonic anhydrase, mitochondrial [Raphidocelis subcapitata]|eukprot:GBF89259.1 gamma carbonic anhydrase, mitochondrial [Raphidocelis subcapitata]